MENEYLQSYQKRAIREQYSLLNDDHTEFQSPLTTCFQETAPGLWRDCSFNRARWLQDQNHIAWSTKRYVEKCMGTFRPRPTERIWRGIFEQKYARLKIEIDVRHYMYWLNAPNNVLREEPTNQLELSNNYCKQSVWGHWDKFRYICKGNLEWRPVTYLKRDEYWPTF